MAPTISPERTLRVAAVSGSLHSPSKTTTLVTELLNALARQRTIQVDLIELSETGPLFAGVLRRDQLSESAEQQLLAIEGADLLVVATPVYRASYTGLFKHFFDFVDQYALVDKPVLLAATGGSDRHALIIEHQLRPLFGFFQALTLPIGVYAKDSEFADYTICDDDLLERIERAISRGLPLLAQNSTPTHPSVW
jgi:FMN reductase